MKNKKKFMILTALLVVICAIIGLVWYEMHQNHNTEKEIGSDSDEDFAKSMMPSSVMITVGEKHASGIILSIDEDKVCLVTAGHLVKGYSQGIISFYTGNVGFGNVEVISDNPDVCIMTFKTEYLDSDLLRELKAVKHDITHYEELKAEDEVFFVGSVFAAGSNAVKGRVGAKDFYVDDFDSRMLYLYSDVMAGMSGCGVYDKDGYLVGILSGGNDTGEAVAVSLPQIYEKLEEIEND